MGLPFSCRGETVKGMNHRIKRAAYLPRRRAVGARGSSVGGSAARRCDAVTSCERRRRRSARRPHGRRAVEACWCARQNRLPLFAVLRLDARAKCARGGSTSRGLLRLGLRHRRSDPIVITDRSSSLCVHGPPGSIRWAEPVYGASPPRRLFVGAAATRLPRTIHRCGGGRRASTETAAELVLWSRGGHRL